MAPPGPAPFPRLLGSGNNADWFQRGVPEVSSPFFPAGGAGEVVLSLAGWHHSERDDSGALAGDYPRPLVAGTEPVPAALQASESLYSGACPLPLTAVD